MSIGIPFRGFRTRTGQPPGSTLRRAGDGLSGVVGDFKATGVIATAAMATARSHQCSPRRQIVGLLCMPPLALARLHRSSGVSCGSTRQGSRHSRGLPVLRLSFRDAYRSERFAPSSLIARTSSLGVFQRPPLHRLRSRVHSRASLLFGLGVPPTRLVPPLPFFPASTVYTA